MSFYLDLKSHAECILWEDIMLCPENKWGKGNNKPPKIYADLEQEEVQLLVPLASPPYNPGENSNVSPASKASEGTSEAPPEAWISEAPVGTSQGFPEARASTTSVRTLEASPEAQCDSSFSPIAHHTQQKTRPVIQAPLIKAVGPQGKPVFVHVPFTTSDLLNWKQGIGFYRDNPAAMNQLLETIMITHNPNWGDMQALLSIFFTAEEKTMVLEKAQEEMRQRHPWGEAEELVLIKKDSKWDPNTSRGQQLIEQYRQLILYGIQHGIPKPNNLSKLYEVH